MDVSFANIHVVRSDINPGALAPPPSKRPTREVPADELFAMSRGELQVHLEALLRDGARSRSLDEAAPDGSPRIHSMVSVWLISQVGKVVGKPKLVNLSGVPKDDLRSLAGVARVAHGALDSLARSLVAS